MHSTTLSFTGRSLLFCASAAAATAVFARADASAVAAMSVAESVELDKFVISATRTPQDPQTTPSAVTAINLKELDELQIIDLRGALAQEPGVIVVQTGSTGGQASVFMRGANTHQTLFVVDGIRMNDRSATYLNFLGGADLTNLGRVEVLRGPQSTLYGSSAMGGVILLETARGSGAPSGVLGGMGGSFDTLGGSAAVAGSQANLSYSGGVARYVTANDLPSNDFRQWSYSTRLEYAATSDLMIGATFRGQNDDFQQTGSRFFPGSGAVTSDNYLGTAYAELRVAEAITSKLTAGLHRRHYTFSDKWGVSDLSNYRKVVDWQNTWEASKQLQVVAGAGYERSRYTVDGVRSKDEVKAGYVSGTWNPTTTVTLNAGLRYDDFKSVGSATTGRLGASWRPVAGTKLRSTYGTGFAAPGSDDRYGVAEWGQLPNPNLKPEKSRGWDVGFDQKLCENAQLELTYFENRFRNLFEWEYVDFVTYQGRTANRAKAKTNGVEVALRARVSDNVQTRLSYTYLEAKDSGTDKRLARRPRHVLDADVTVQPISVWTMGAGLHAVSDRVERSGPIEDYTTVRVFTSYAVRKDLTLKLRVENALDEQYEEVLGYASLPRAIFGSAEWRF